MKEIKILEIANKLKHPTPLPIAKEIYEFSNGDDRKIEEILQELSKDKPWEYIRGYTYFLDCKITVNKNTLIPRPETETLVQIALEDIKEINKNVEIIDVGTGSGCIAISLAKALNREIIAVDISKKALHVAKENARLNNCKNIKFVNANLLDFDLDTKIPKIIVANLPYIPSNEMPKLEKSVQGYEPLKALDGGKNGTKYYEILLEQIKEKCVNLEYAIFEIDKENIKSMQKILKTYDYEYVFLNDQFERIRFLKINPSHPRQPSVQ